MAGNSAVNKASGVRCKTVTNPGRLENVHAIHIATQRNLSSGLSYTFSLP